MVEDTSPNNALLTTKSGGNGGIVFTSRGSDTSHGGNAATDQVCVQIVQSQPKTLSHLPTRPPVDLAFHDLKYSVREGRRNRKSSHRYFCISILV